MSSTDNQIKTALFNQNDLLSEESLPEIIEPNYEEYKQFEKAFLNLVLSLIETSKIKTHTVSSRTKNIDSIIEKIERKGYKNSNQLTDICGIRIITYFTEDIERIASLIEKEFQIDTINSVDKRNYSDFGYSSLHYVCLLNDKRLELGEYRKFTGMKCEVQIRTILQHAWAEIEHDLGYKGSIYLSLSEQKAFRRIAALLEQADMEFMNLNQVALNTTQGTAITEQSIRDLIQNNETVNEIDKQICEFMKSKNDKFELVDDLGFLTNKFDGEISSLLIDRDFRIFRFIEIKYNEDLERILSISKSDLLKTFTLVDETERDFFNITRTSLPKGYTLGVLVLHMILHSSDLIVVVKDRLKDYYRQRIERVNWKYQTQHNFDKVIEVLLAKYQMLPLNERKIVS
jgi:putative GTP pyrophosphokinase